mmetsp:Transcript_18945/g.61916  ORF Transcript_18945/g.61916 Transcript_18945/m.61916 type:complete len:249 (+) Transcript_18945:803-1549(+)
MGCTSMGCTGCGTGCSTQLPIVSCSGSGGAGPTAFQPNFHIGPGAMGGGVGGSGGSGSCGSSPLLSMPCLFGGCGSAGLGNGGQLIGIQQNLFDGGGQGVESQACFQHPGTLHVPVPLQSSVGRGSGVSGCGRHLLGMPPCLWCDTFAAASQGTAAVQGNVTATQPHHSRALPGNHILSQTDACPRLKCTRIAQLRLIMFPTFTNPQFCRTVHSALSEGTPPVWPWRGVALCICICSTRVAQHNLPGL